MCHTSACAPPAFVVFSGRSAYELFCEQIRGAIDPPIDPRDRETYDLLATTTRWPHYLSIEETIGAQRFSLRARVVIAPHFSYDDNFMPHSRLSPQAWEEFASEEPAAAAALEALGAIRERSRDGYTPVDIRNLGEFQTRYSTAMPYLLRSFYEPSQMIGMALEARPKSRHIGWMIAV